MVSDKKGNLIGIVVSGMLMARLNDSRDIADRSQLVAGQWRYGGHGGRTGPLRSR